MNTKAIQAKIDRVAGAIEEIRAGRMILVRDDEGRENEADLICAAELADQENVGFMAVRGRGLICQALEKEAARRLDLYPQAHVNADAMGTAFTVSVDAAEGVTTGISAADRAHTARLLASPDSRPEDFRRPGHLFPLVAKPGGVYARRGHTEAAVDMARLAGLRPSALICEVMLDDGRMAAGEALENLAREWKMPLITIEELILYREASGDIRMEETPAVTLPTRYGEFRSRAFRSEDPQSRELILLEHPGRKPGAAPLVRFHSECLTGEALHSLRCDCGPQLEAALEAIAREGGALVYLKQEGRGIGLFEKMKAYALQDEGEDTVEANLSLGHEPDLRRYGAAAAVLKRNEYTRVRMMTNNPQKMQALKLAGIEINERVELYRGESSHNRNYLKTKISRMGHIAPATQNERSEKSA